MLDDFGGVRRAGGGIVHPNRYARITFYRYEHESFTFRAGRLLYFVVERPGVETSRGVAVGDPLDEARRRYPELTCDVLEAYEHAPRHEACGGRLDERRYLWLGGDPVRSITVSAAPVEGL